MINLNSSTIPPVSTDETRAFFALMNLVTDPGASAKRISELNEIAQKATEETRLADQAKAQLADARSAHADHLRTSRAEHDAKLAREREAFDNECAIAMNEIRRLKSETVRLHRAATADAAAAAESKADLNTRLEKLKAAMS